MSGILSLPQLMEKLVELKSLLRKFRFDLSLGRLPNCMQIRKTKKEIARTYTKITQVRKSG